MTGTFIDAVSCPVIVESFHVLPLSVLYCHRYFRLIPAAVTRNVTVLPPAAVTEAGCLEISGSLMAVTIADRSAA